MASPAPSLPPAYVQKTLRCALDYAVMQGMLPAPTTTAIDRFVQSPPVWRGHTPLPGLQEDNPAQAHAYFPLRRDEDGTPTVDLPASLVVLVQGYPFIFDGAADYPYPKCRYLPASTVIERDGTSLTEGETHRRVSEVEQARRGNVGYGSMHLPYQGYVSLEAHLRWATGHPDAPPPVSVRLRKAPRSNVPRVQDSRGAPSRSATNFWRSGTYLLPRVLRHSPPGVVVGAPGVWEDPTGAPGAPTHTLLLGRDPGLPHVIWEGVDRFHSDLGVLRVHAQGARYILGHYRHPGWDPYQHSVVEGWESVSIHTVPVTVPTR